MISNIIAWVILFDAEFLQINTSTSTPHAQEISIKIIIIQP